LVGENQLTGTFPSSISNLTELQIFEISWNAFDGPIPLTLGRLNKLERIHFSGNNFGNGEAHDLDFLSSLTNCTQLSMLVFDQNRFAGELRIL